MSERKISKKSLENLKISNEESNRITKESLEISLLQLLQSGGLLTENKYWQKVLGA